MYNINFHQNFEQCASDTGVSAAANSGAWRLYAISSLTAPGKKIIRETTVRVIGCRGSGAASSYVTAVSISFLAVDPSVVCKVCYSALNKCIRRHQGDLKTSVAE